MQKGSGNASCFNLNFSNPGGSTGLESINLGNCSSDELASEAGSKESTPQLVMMDSFVGTPKSASNRSLLPNGKKTKGRVKIEMKYIGNKLRRYTTFSKRKTGIMKKAHELSTLTGTQVMLIVASETGHVYAFATNKLKPLISGGPGKSMIQGCLNAPDDPANDANAVKTEFTFEPPNGCPTLPNARKRKLDANEEMTPLPTMVSSSSPLNDYCDSDNESEEVEDSRMDDEDGTNDQPPILRQSKVDPINLIREAMMAAAEQRQRQTKVPKRKPQPQINRQKQKNDENPFSNVKLTGNEALDQLIFPLILQGLVASQTDSSPTTSPCRASSSTPSPNPVDNASTSKSIRPRKSEKIPKIENFSNQNSPSSFVVEQPTILFQVPQGTVYATESPSITPPPLLHNNSSTSFNTGNFNDEPKLFANSTFMNGSSTSTTSSTSSLPNTNDDHNLQHLLNTFGLNSGNTANNSANNPNPQFQQAMIAAFLSHFNESNGQMASKH